MYIDEFLIKIGVDATQAGKINDVINQLSKGANKLGENANEIAGNIKKSVDNVAEGTTKLEGNVDKAETKTSKLKLGLLALVAASVFIGKSLLNTFNSAINGAEELSKKKNTLFKISKQEIAQAKQYKDAMTKSGLAIDSIKTKIALNLAPSITNIVNSFNKWMTANKDLIVNGIGAAIKVIGKYIQVITNFFRFLDKVISSTIGWKNALGVLAVAWAVFNRALLFSPIGIVVGLFTGLLLLIDDLMTYMDGGDSLFGEYWQPLIDGAKIAWDAIKKLYEYLKPIFMLIKSIWAGDIDGIVKYSKESWESISNAVSAAFDTIVGYVSSATKSILMYFGMSEEDATRTVAAMGEAFDLITGLIAAPFKAAWNYIKSLFNIWTDDSTSFVDKLGLSFEALKDFIITPFKKGMDWIKDKFFGFIDTIKSKLSFLSYIGIDIGGGESSASDADIDAALKSLRDATKAINGSTMPAAQNGLSSTKNNTVNQSMQNNITINTSDTSTGINQTVDALSSQLKSTMDNAKSGMGAN